MLLDITKNKDNKFEIEISYEMKDSLKSAIPSVKWDSAKSVWVAGIRSFKKLEKWAAAAKEEFDFESISKKIEDKNEKMKKMYILYGDTFVCKDELKERFDVSWDSKNKNWLVSADDQEKAQLFVENYDRILELRDNKINKEMFTKCNSYIDLLKLLKKLSKNFYISLDNKEYKQDDEFKKLLVDIEDEDFLYIDDIKSIIDYLVVDLEKALVFLDENDNIWNISVVRHRSESLFDFLNLEAENKLY